MKDKVFHALVNLRIPLSDRQENGRVRMRSTNPVTVLASLQSSSQTLYDTK